MRISKHLFHFTRKRSYFYMKIKLKIPSKFSLRVLLLKSGKMTPRVLWAKATKHFHFIFTRAGQIEAIEAGVVLAVEQSNWDIY